MKNTILALRNTIWFTIKLIEFIALNAAFAIIWLYKYEQAQYIDRGNFIIFILYVVILFLTFKTFSCFKFDINRVGELIYSTIVALLITNFLTALIFSLISKVVVELQWLLLLQLIQTAFILLYDWLINTLYFKYCTVIEVVAIYNDSKISYFAISKMSRLRKKYQIKEIVNQLSGMESIKEAINRHGSVLLCDVDDGCKNEIITYCYEQSKRVYILPSVSDILVNNAQQVQMFDTPVYVCQNKGPSNEQLAAKRLIDIFFSLIGLIIASPFMLIIALLIKCYDGGPVFYRQTRVTKGNKIMQILKFRSMRTDAEKDGIAQMATKNDSRVTPVGRVIRMIRFDELPQIINILKGDMSIVGPRPERPELIAEYAEKYPEFVLRTKVKAGLTGLAQVEGRYNTHPYDKMMFDLIYIESYSLLLDIKIMLMTVKILFMPESTQGVEDGQQNADSAINFDITKIDDFSQSETPGGKV